MDEGSRKKVGICPVPHPRSEKGERRRDRKLNVPEGQITGHGGLKVSRGKSSKLVKL